MALRTPVFTSPSEGSIQSKDGFTITGVGEPRTNVSIAETGVGHEFASVFCDENGHFSARITLGHPETVSFTAQCRLANEYSEWSHSLRLNIQ